MAGFVRRIMGKSSLILAAAFVLVFAGAWDGVAATAEKVTVRAGLHKEFARLVFDWNSEVGVRASVNNRMLTIGFNKPIDPALDGVRKALRSYVTSIKLASDGRTVLAGLTDNFRIKTTRVGQRVVIDLLKNISSEPARSPARAGRASKPVSQPAAAPPTRLGPRADRSTPVSRKPGAASESAVLSVRTGHHKDYGRLIFGWPKKVGFTVDRQGQAVTIRFDTPALVDIAALRRELPSQISAAITRPAEAGLEIGLVIPTEAQLRYFHNSTAVVFDVVSPTNASATGPATATQTRRESASKSASKKNRKSAKKKQAKPPALPFVSVDATRKGAETIIRFNWRKPVAAAMFRRDASYWIVFDHPARIDLGPIQVIGNGMFRNAEQYNDGDAVQIRLPVSPAFEPLVRREGTVWVLETGPGRKRAIRDLPLEIRANGRHGPELLIKALKRGRVIPVRNRQVGDAVYTVPLFNFGYGIGPHRRFPEFELLDSPQGIAIRPLDDALRVRTEPDGIVISKAGGLNITQGAVAADRKRHTGEEKIFELADWQYGPATDFQKIEHELLQYVTQPKGVRRNAARLSLARFYASHGMGPEALSVVNTLLSENPQLLRDPKIRALRGLANYQIAHYAESDADFSHPSLAGTQELYPWRAGIAAARGDWAGAQRLFAGTDSIISTLPSRFAVDLGLLAAEAALSVKEKETAEARLSALSALPAVGGQLDYLAYLKGHLLRQKGENDKAVEIWQAVARDSARPIQAKASFAIINTQLDAGEIEATEAIDRLEGLKFAWRNNVFEFDLLNRLGQLYATKRNLRDALVTLRKAVTLYKDIKGAQALTERMRTMFRTFYLEGEADHLEPVVALGLYNEFRELTPTGADGDRMIRRLAERLIKVDLLGESAKLLDHQVEFRLKKEEKAETGARLAEILLLDEKPQEALEALEKSNQPDIPDPLSEKRRHLRSAALMDAHRYEDALQEIATDFVEEFDMLRAQIFWRAGRWQESSRALARLTGGLDPQSLTDRDAELLLRRSVALGLAGDRAGMKFLRDRFGAAMEKSSQAAAFKAVAGGKLLKAKDYAALARRAAELETFRAFMDTVRRNQPKPKPDQTAALN